MHTTKTNYILAYRPRTEPLTWIGIVSTRPDRDPGHKSRNQIPLHETAFLLKLRWSSETWKFCPLGCTLKNKCKIKGAIVVLEFAES